LPPVIGLIITLISYPPGFQSLETIGYVLLYSYSLGIPCIALFDYTEKKLDNRYPWLQYPNKRLIFSIITEVALIIAILLIVNTVFVYIESGGIDDLSYKISDSIFWAVGLTITGILFTNGFMFFKNWRQAAINEEKLKHEKLSLEYEALKNQVNPHFLFNSLTALKTLVYENQDQAADFIKKFSAVYRYVLENRYQELVTLKQEIKLIHSMASLYQYRHGNNLRIEINLQPSEKKLILCMALQMLMENALKHNVISKNNPLTIKINESEDTVVVWNNLQPKNHVPDSNKIGLNNIKYRYKYLTGREVDIDETNDYFQVKLPILESL
jgi:sensor histidine kinase YesM